MGVSHAPPRLRVGATSQPRRANSPPPATDPTPPRPLEDGQTSTIDWDLGLHGTVYSDCLSAVKKITRKWTPGHSYQEAGASLVSSCRAYLSSTISLKWVKGHPERSEHPPSAWSRQQWGIYIVDALSKNRDLSSLRHSPVPSIRHHHLSLQAMLQLTPSTSWHWIGPDSAPPLGNLRSMLSYHRVLAYRTNRDRLREDRGAPPIWLDSHQSVGPASWSRCTQPLRQRVRALRSLWDLRWHGENRAVAARAVDPQVSTCPICRRHWDQAHVLCECPCTSGARSAGSLDLSIAISRLAPGPMQELGRKFQRLLIIPNQPSLMARRWSGQWDQAAIGALQPEIARAELTSHSDALPPPTPAVEGQTSTMDWDPRLGEDHG